MGYISLPFFFLCSPTFRPNAAVRPPAMTRTGRANIADADHASLGGTSPIYQKAETNHRHFPHRA
jgi:hypothetical protein